MVDCENGKISYFLTRKSVKNVNLRVKSDSRVLLSANNSVTTEFIDAFIKQKQKYILSALTKFEEKMKLVEETREETVFTDGIYIFLKVKDKNNFCHKRIMMNISQSAMFADARHKLACEKFIFHTNHSRQFWDFVAMMMPDWKERKKELEKGI